MKKITAIWLLLLLLAGCQRTSAADIPLSDAMHRVQGALGGAAGFTLADEDFAALNFGEIEGVEAAMICFDSGNDTREIGVFRLNDRRLAGKAKEKIEKYLKTEENALASLAHLYPAEELERRLSLYKNATVGSEGMLLYYFVLEPKDAQKALAALTGRQN
jgi:hypothetical protein